MKSKPSIIRTLLSLLLSLSMVITYLPAAMISYATDDDEPEAVTIDAESDGVEPQGKEAEDDVTVLAFSSDVHNGGNNSDRNDIAANRLQTWIQNVERIYGDIEVMAFGGDMASYYVPEDAYWDYTQHAMDAVSEEIETGIYTTGNHEYNPGNLGGENSYEPQEKLKINTQVAEGSNYRIYCLGSMSSTSSYLDQVSSLASYLEGVDNTKPIFIITHFPLHYASSRTTNGAANIIDVLNEAVTNGTEDPSDDKKIVFLWGHNHTNADRDETHYDEIFKPGDSFQYAKGSENKTIQFYYAAAGCMSDSEYSTGSGAVKGKGLIVEIDSNNLLKFTYYNESATDVTEGGPFQEIAITSASINEATALGDDGQPVTVSPTVKAGRSLQLHLSVEPADATIKAVNWYSSDTGVATVSSKGRVRGVDAGTATITAEVTDGITGQNFSASIDINVTERTSEEQYCVIMIDNYALGSRASSDRMTTTSGYEYYGLEGVEWSPEDAAPYRILWKLEPAEEAEDGFYIKSADGDYLSASYVKNSSGYTGTLRTGDEKDVWIATSGLDDWELDGSTLKSSHASMNANNNREMFLADINGDGGSNMFTVRSSSDSAVHRTSVLIEPDETLGPVKAEEITLDPDSLTVEEGKTAAVKVSVSPADTDDPTVTWSSSDETVATVNNGTVTGITEGTATITATANSDESVTASCAVTVIPPVIPPAYVISIDGYALSTEPETDYHPESNGTNKYYGLKGVMYDPYGDTDESMLWRAIPVDGVTRGYNIQSMDGRYLNAYYKNTNPLEGRLYLSDTPDVWVLDGEFDNWLISGSYLKSMNASIANKDLCLAYETVGAAGNVNMFTVRSRANADNSTLVHVHTFGEPAWTWADDYTSASAAFVCSDCGEEKVVDAAVSSTAHDGVATHTATAEIKGKSYTDKKIENITYSVAFNANGGAGTMADQEFYFEGSTEEDRLLKANAFTREGHSFDGWNTRPDGSGTAYADRADFGDECATNGAVVQLYAQWKPNQYKLKFYLNEGDDEAYAVITQNYGTEITAPDNPDKAFCTFDGWNAEVPDTMPAGDRDFYAKWIETDAYYLVGTMNDWKVSDDYEFAAGSQNTEEYSINTKLTAGDKIKVVRAVGGKKVDSDTYPGSDHPGFNGWTDDYTVDKYHSGNVTVYFRPEGNFEDKIWQNFGGFFYVERAHSVTVTVSPEKTGEAHVTADGSVNMDAVMCGTPLTVHYAPADNYRIDRIEILKDDGSAADITLDGNTFSMPDFDIEVKVYFRAIKWTLDKFKWTGNDESGYTAAAVSFNGDDGSSRTVDAKLTSKTTPAACEEAGKTVYTASLAAKDSPDGAEHSDEKTVVIAALGHNAVVDVAVEPTCTKTGLTEGSHCSVCGKVLVQQKTIPASGHTEVVDKAVEPTCTETGLTEGSHCSVCGEVLVAQDIIPANGHTEVIDAAVEPTCTKTGLTEGSHCSVCGKTIKAQRVERALGHDWKAATCTEPKTCRRCNAIEGKELGHRFTDYKSNNDATCTEDGTKTAKCDRCDVTDTQADKGSALGHDWSEWEVTKAATCTEKGTETRTCARCEKEETREIAALGHKEEEIPAVSPTCTEPGSTAGKKCSVCGEILEAPAEISAFGHKEEEIPAVSPTCTKKGSTAGKKCSACGEILKAPEEIPALGHKGTEIPAVTPTCTEKGSTAGSKCSVCGEILKAPEEIPALGHNWSEWEVTKAATCTEKGAERRTCSRCDEEETREIAANGHTEEEIPGVSPTCTETGSTAGKKCSVCGEILVAPRTIRALGHRWSGWEVTKAATCTEKGTERRTCSRCNEEETREIAALGHKETEIPAAAPTCTEKGSTAGKKCSVCGEILEAPEEIAAFGHKEVEIPAVSPTCTEPGSTAGKKCSVCGEILEAPRTILALGHKEEEIPVVSPTCTEPGSTAGKKCSVCGEILVAPAEIAAFGHKEEEIPAVAPTCTKKGSTAGRKCSACGKILEAPKEIAALGHDWKAATCTEPKTCERCKLTEGKALGHDWKAATCTVPKTCKRCKGTEGKALGHSFTEYKSNNDATCTKDGTKTAKCDRCDVTDTKPDKWSALGHDWKAATCTEPKTCERCKLAEGKALGHDWKAATCTEPKTCERCNETEGEALGHDWKAATCTEPKTCERCNETEGEALGHDIEDNYTVDVPSTCSVNGRQSRHCKNCDAKFDSKILPATEHTPDEGKVTKDPTTDKEGVMTYTCTECGGIFTKPIPKLENEQVDAGKAVDNAGESVAQAETSVENLTDTSSVTAFADADKLANDAVSDAEAAEEKAEEAYRKIVEEYGKDSEAAAYAQTMVDDAKQLKAKALTASAGVKIKNAKSSGYKADKASSDAADAAATPGDEAVAAAEKAETLAKEAAKAAADALEVAEAAFEAVKNAGFEPDSKVYKEAEKAVSTATDLKKEADAAVVRATKAVAEAKEAKEEAKPAPAPGGGEEGSPAGSDDEQSDGDSAIPTPGSQAAPGSDPDQKGEDGTEVGPGASAASADKAIKNMPDDKDPAGSVYSRLRLRSPKQTSTSIKLTWKKDSKAVSYVIYGNKCGKTTKPRKLATVKGKTTKTFKKVAGKKLRKGTYYKFIIVALDKNNNVVSTSKLIHVATKGGKIGNFKSVTIGKTVINKAGTLTPGKKLRIRAKAVVQSGKLKVKVHRGLKYESSNKKIAAVTSKGVIKAKKKGSCYIYVYTQNGIYKRIKVVVK